MCSNKHRETHIYSERSVSCTCDVGSVKKSIKTRNENDTLVRVVYTCVYFVAFSILVLLNEEKRISINVCAFVCVCVYNKSNTFLHRLPNEAAQNATPNCMRVPFLFCDCARAQT